ncbi:MAG: VCBS repeat-containing protein [Alphaproteobacteria bacterium]|nr:VCBS repeat-containing protein [Alphaproteobacteria bacterium]
MHANALKALRSRGNDSLWTSCLAKVLAVALLAGISASGTAQAAPAMALQGRQSVDNLGQFHYSIPIAVPPGSSGMVPQLALEYSSTNVDGLEGYGWALRGLSGIARCAQTVLFDGVHGGVNYDGNDRFCLDGEEIELTNASSGYSYGDSGSTYDTASGKFYLIVANGSAGAGNGPSYFQVHLPNGTTLELGNTTDSRILASGSSKVRAWLVDKITDIHGNYLTVKYTNDNANGQAYPVEIDYTGNSSVIPNTSPYNSVVFQYASRGDITPTYEAGSLKQYTKLLTDIITYNGMPSTGTQVLHYQLGYRTGSSLLHSRLTSLSLCDGSGANCLPQMSFSWQGGAGLPAVSSVTASQTPVVTGDFNGDGLLDIGVSGCPTGGIIYSGTSTVGSFTSANMNASYEWWNPSHQTYSGPACLNNLTPKVYHTGWSYDSIIATQPDSSGHNFTSLLLDDFLNTNSFFQWALNPGLPVFNLVGDFDGDGAADGLVQSSSANGTFYSGANSFLGSGTAVTGVGTSYSLTPGDFDGDGCTDLLAEGSTNAIHFFCQSLGTTASAPSFSGSTIVPGDFNGDAKADLLVIGSTSATLYLSNGKGLPATPLTVSGVPSWAGYHVITGDWNGDGKMDIALISTTGGTHKIYLSTGVDFSSAGTISDSATSAIVVDANNDGADDIWFSGTNDIYYYAYQPELMTAVNNNIGLVTSVGYDRLNKDGVFYDYTGSVGYKVFNGPYYAARTVSFSNGTGSGYTNYSLTYSYDDAAGDLTLPPVPGPKSNVLSARIRVMGQVMCRDSRTGLVTIQKYWTSQPKFGLPIVTKVNVPSGPTIYQASYDYTGTFHQGGTSPVFPLTITVDRADLDGTAFQERVSGYLNDAYGNPQVVQTTGGSETLTVTNTITNNTLPINYVLGQITETDVQSQVGSTSQTRHYSYDRYGNGDVQNAYLEKGSTALQLKTAYGYDGFGNVNSVTKTGNDIATRSNSAQFDANGEFTTYRQNPGGQQTMTSFDPRFGNLTSVTDINSLTTNIVPDWLGRPTDVTRPDLNQVAVSYGYCAGVNGGTASCPATGAYVVTATPKTSTGLGSAQNGAVTSTYYDAFDRVIAMDTQGFNGSAIRVSRVYDDVSGRMLKTSRPYFVSGGTPQWTTYALDAMSRPTSITYPDASQTTFSYCGPTTSVTNAKGQTKTVVRDDRGNISSVTDGQSGTVTACLATGGTTATYTYDEFGNSLTAKVGLHTIVNTFDLRGRKSTSTDPDMGYWQFGYDQLNGLISQTDAKSNTTQVTYDSFENPLTRTEHDAGAGTNFYSKWLWNPTNGNGKLMNACTDASNCPSASYQQKPTYDSLSRVATGAFVLDGTTYTYTPTYNSDGQVSTLTYPSGFQAKYLYNTYGYLKIIKDKVSGTPIWAINSADAELHVTQQTLGTTATGTTAIVSNGIYDPATGNLLNVCASWNSGPCDGNTQNTSYDWDSVGNLTERDDTLHNYVETFCYDDQNRVVHTARAASCNSGTTAKTFAYDALGNLNRKSDVCTTAGCFNYDGTGGAGPHELTSITGTYNGVANPTFSYDANGNMTGGAGRSFTYTPFNMTSSITQGAGGAALAYGAWHNRYKMCVPNCASPTTTVYYLYDPATGGMSEKIVSGSSTTWVDYIVAPGVGLVALRIQSPSGVQWRYIVNDHLGSVTSVANNTGTPSIESDSYDTWGKRRNADGSDNTTCSITSQTTRGYTGHEMLDSYCLINMNARVQDPSLGRYLSADSIVPDAYDTQAFNRTTYVRNNPMKLIDPSGHDPKCITDPLECETIVVTGGYNPDPGCGGGCGGGGLEVGPQGLTAGGGGGGDSSSEGKAGDQGIETVVVYGRRIAAAIIPFSFLIYSNPTPQGLGNGQGNGGGTQCHVNKNENGWGRFFITQGGYFTRSGAMVVAMGAGNPDADAVGGGALLLGELSIGAGMVLMYDAGNGWEAADAGFAAEIDAGIPDMGGLTAAAPTDGATQSAADYLTNSILGANPCP